MFSTTKKTGILGGGQLGKMLCIAAANLDLKTYCLDESADFPAGSVCTGFTEGSFRNYDDVMAFGSDKDTLTIEIEHVNMEALRDLERMGKAVHPHPRALEIIRDKGLQKQFYAARGIPTAPFQVFESEKELLAALTSGHLRFPFVQKIRRDGYDGRGVSVLRSEADVKNKLLQGPCIAETLAPIAAEIAVIAARNPQGEIRVYPAVEMDFHPEANLVERLLCPARISPLAAAQAEAIAERLIGELEICGLLAVEMFLNTDGQIWVNEAAPRPHNSGHHTIDSAVCSQFEQHLRAINGLPLGDTRMHSAAVMLNLLGEAGYDGPVEYDGTEQCLSLPGVHLHLYGKARAKPMRKMGHLTVTAPALDEAVEIATKARQLIRVISRSE